MFLAHFTERPYQDPTAPHQHPDWARGRELVDTTTGFDLSISNSEYNPVLGAELYHRYLREKVFIEEMGFDGVMLNEHHSTPFCMGNVLNPEAAILAYITQRVKIVLLGSLIPLWDDPIWLAEELAIIDTISRGRLVTGFIRGTGRESFVHNVAPPHNWERFREAHDLIVKAWTTPGPFRWEGEHFHFRYVNLWPRPYSQPHPPIWVPGVISRNTVKWAAEHRYPYVLVGLPVEAGVQVVQYYHECAREYGYEAGTQHIGYMVRVHVDETDEAAYESGRKLLSGPANPFLEGNTGRVHQHIQNPPGLTVRSNLLPTGAAQPLGRQVTAPAAQTLRGRPRSYEEQLQNYTIIAGSPKTVVSRVRHILERMRPGCIIFWDGDGSMTHEESIRSIRLMGTEVLPALRDVAKELEINSAFEVDPATNKPARV